MTKIDFRRLSSLFAPRRAAYAAVLAGMAISSFARAHHPDRENQPVTPIIDVIGPMGNRLGPGHRRKYNRPGYWAGKVAYWIAPSSQEAMVWHRSQHSGAYEAPKKSLRLEQHFFYPKPYHALTVGPRRATAQPQPIRSTQPEMIAPTPDESNSTPLENSAPLELTEPAAEGLPEPAPQQQLELPAIEANEEAVSPSDSVKGESVKLPPSTDPFALISDAYVRRAFGKADETRVSRANRAKETSELDVASKPVFLRRMLVR